VMQLSWETLASWERALGNWKLLAAMSEQKMRNVNHCQPLQTPLASPLIHSLWIFLEHQIPPVSSTSKVVSQEKVYFWKKI
jgi:hypothetical protein